MVVYILKLLGKDEVYLGQVFMSYAEAEHYIRTTGKSYYVPVKARLTLEQ